MGRRVQIVFLCEDSQHQSFGLAFLGELTGIRNIETVRAGSRANVINRFPKELKALRSRSGSALVVMIDADKDSVSDVRQIIDQKLAQTGEPPVRVKDLVFVASPKWRIENWIQYLREGHTDESKQGPRLDKENSCREDAKRLFESCIGNVALLQAPESLESACAEWKPFRNRIKH